MPKAQASGPVQFFEWLVSKLMNIRRKSQENTYYQQCFASFITHNCLHIHLNLWTDQVIVPNALKTTAKVPRKTQKNHQFFSGFAYCGKNKAFWPEYSPLLGILSCETWLCHTEVPPNVLSAHRYWIYLLRLWLHQLYFTFRSPPNFEARRKFR